MEHLVVEMIDAVEENWVVVDEEDTENGIDNCDSNDVARGNDSVDFDTKMPTSMALVRDYSMRMLVLEELNLVSHHQRKMMKDVDAMVEAVVVVDEQLEEEEVVDGADCLVVVVELGDVAQVFHVSKLLEVQHCQRDQPAVNHCSEANPMKDHGYLNALAKNIQ